VPSCKSAVNPSLPAAAPEAEPVADLEQAARDIAQTPNSSSDIRVSVIPEDVLSPEEFEEHCAPTPTPECSRIGAIWKAISRGASAVGSHGKYWVKNPHILLRKVAVGSLVGAALVWAPQAAEKLTNKSTAAAIVIAMFFNDILYYVRKYPVDKFGAPLGRFVGWAFGWSKGDHWGEIFGTLNDMEQNMSFFLSNQIVALAGPIGTAREAFQAGDLKAAASRLNRAILISIGTIKGTLIEHTTLVENLYGSIPELETLSSQDKMKLQMYMLTELRNLRVARLPGAQRGVQYTQEQVTEMRKKVFIIARDAMRVWFDEDYISDLTQP
jgi:hypothetical protein